MKKRNNKTSSQRECVDMSKGIREFLAKEFPEVSLDIALLVLLRIAVALAVRQTSKERAPIILSRLINEFLLTDHTDK